MCLQDGPQDERPAADSIRCKGMGGTVEMRSTDFEGTASEQWQLLTVGLSDRHFLATVMTERRRLLHPPLCSRFHRVRHQSACELQSFTAQLANLASHMRYGDSGPTGESAVWSPRGRRHSRAGFDGPHSAACAQPRICVRSRPERVHRVAGDRKDVGQQAIFPHDEGAQNACGIIFASVSGSGIAAEA